MTAEPSLTTHLKSSLPFRLGAASWIIPAGMAENVRLLSGVVDDVELLFLESHETSPLPTSCEIETLREAARAAGHSYTVHFPLDIELGSSDESVRLASVEKCLHVWRLTLPLTPFAWILHLDGCLNFVSDAQSMGWLDACRRSIETLTAHIPSMRLCVETLLFDFELLSDLIVEFDLGVCLDTGHVERIGQNPMDLWWKWKDRIMVVHLHAVNDGKDHQSLSWMPADRLRHILEAVAAEPAKSRIVTLELFSKTKLEESMSIVAQASNSWCVNTFSTPSCPQEDSHA